MTVGCVADATLTFSKELSYVSTYFSSEHADETTRIKKQGSSQQQQTETDKQTCHFKWQ